MQALNSTLVCPARTALYAGKAVPGRLYSPESQLYRLPCRGAVYTRNWYGHELAELGFQMRSYILNYSRPRVRPLAWRCATRLPARRGAECARLVVYSCAACEPGSIRRVGVVRVYRTYNRGTSRTTLGVKGALFDNAPCRP